MMLLSVGCSHRTAPVDVREKIAFHHDQLTRALEEIPARFQCETVILSTCNRVELYLARPEADPVLPQDAVADYLAELHGAPRTSLLPFLYDHRQGEAVHHLFRVI